jgi:hypothetical protein
VQAWCESQVRHRRIQQVQNPLVAHHGWPKGNGSI